jgi:hypothetical protein
VRAKFARICFRPAISLMLKPKEVHSPNFNRGRICLQPRLNQRYKSIYVIIPKLVRRFTATPSDSAFQLAALGLWTDWRRVGLQSQRDSGTADS